MRLRALLPVLVLVLLVIAVGGCGKSKKTVTVTQTTTAKIPSTETMSEPPPTPPVVEHKSTAATYASARNLSATNSMKNDIRTAALQYAHTVQKNPKETVTGPMKGTTYYAGFGEYEYAFAGFDLKGYKYDEELDESGSFYRK